MKNTKFKQRFANAANAFFAEEDSIEQNLESFGNKSNLRRGKDFSGFADKNSWLETAFKQVFFFFPGTFVLYIMSLVFTIGLINVFFGLSKMTLGFQDFVGILAVFSAAILMTWLGLGDVRKAKHFAIPASIISVGVFLGAIAGVLLIVSQPFARFFRYSDSYSFYFLPLALIVPFLAKGWVDGKTENENFG